MLRIVELNSPDQREEYLQSTEASKATWLIADLPSKWQAQQRFLSESPLLEENSVLRANELWHKLLLKHHPATQIISSSLAQTLVTEWMSEEKLEWARTPGAAKQLFQYLEQLLPVYSHENGLEIMEQWLKSQPSALTRWGNWFYLSARIWQRLWIEKTLPQSWCASALVGFERAPINWSRNLVVDLGSQLSSTEAELLKELSKSVDVTVLKPNPQWAGFYKGLLKAYNRFEDELAEDTPKDWSFFNKENLGSLNFRRMTTMIAEVKAVVAQVRQWLDDGIKPSEIAIVAPDIEYYWPSLRLYLKQEGIPAQKRTVSRIQTLPGMTHWLSELRIRSGRVKSSDLELVNFEEEPRVAIDFSEFEKLFKKIYGPEDLGRNIEIRKLYDQQYKPENVVSRDEFIAWALKHWRNLAPAESLKKICDPFFTECPSRMHLKIKNWIEYFEIVASRMEDSVDDADAEGIFVEKIDSAFWLPVKKLYALGLTESDLKDQRKTAILSSEVETLLRDTGFVIDAPDITEKEFNVAWLTQRNFESCVLSAPNTDFSGSIQAPSLLWLMGTQQANHPVEQVDIPAETRWDQLQKAPIAALGAERSWSEGHQQSLWHSLEQDLGERELPGFGEIDEFSLSATGWERLEKCPFIYAAEKILGLQSFPEVDFDLDRMTKGRLIHAVLAELTVEPMRFNWSEEELSELIDSCRRKEKFIIGDERMWPRAKAHHIKMAQSFLEFEAQWRKDYSATSTLGRELRFKVYRNAEENSWSEEPQPGTVRVSGSIDRLDSDGAGGYVVADYKSSDNQFTHFDKWLEAGQFQLLLYALAVEKGFTSVDPGPVRGAFYFTLREMKRYKGFRRTGEGPELFPPKDRIKNWLSDEELESLFSSLSEKLDLAIGKVKAGGLQPSPKDPDKDCTQCDWRWLCRAPHLN